MLIGTYLYHYNELDSHQRRAHEQATAILSINLLRLHATWSVVQEQNKPQSNNLGNIKASAPLGHFKYR